MVEAICLELQIRRDYLSGYSIRTIYMGGGTPSLLTDSHLDRLMTTLHANYDLSSLEESTLEANPDDMTVERLSQWRSLGIDRLSIGIQSFRDTDLRFMSRAHTAGEATLALDNALRAGFHKLSVDLIYGTPGLEDEDWISNLEIVRERHIPHLSAYSLTVEPRTVLHSQIKSGRLPPLDDLRAATQLRILMDWADSVGYEHYEISNLALPGHYALHNTAYWQGRPYLGAGPSAHSFDGSSRSWNINNNHRYIAQVFSGKPEQETEKLSVRDRYNEWIMTGLRTQWGLSEQYLADQFPGRQQEFSDQIHNFSQTGQIIYRDGCWVLTHTGRLLADGIAAELFWV